MNITIIRDSILKILNNANLFTSSRINDIRVLKGLLITAKKDGIVLSTTNINEYYYGEVGGKVEKEGSILVDFKVFFDLVKNLQDVKINLEKKQNQLCLSSKTSKVKLPLLDVSEFPQLRVGGEKTEINKAIFDFTKLKTVIFSCAVDESRPNLTGVCLDFLENETRLIGTDGFRMSLATLKKKQGIKGLERLIVPGKSLLSLIKVFNGKIKKVEFIKAENQLVFSGEESVVFIRLLEGEFPPYEKVIPQQTETTVSFKRSELINSLRAAAPFAKEGSNMLVVEILNKCIIISSANVSAGEAKFTTPLLSKSGKDNKITFNYKYLLEFLNASEDEEVIFEMKDTFSPGVFKKPKEEGYLHIIMPIRSQE